MATVLFIELAQPTSWQPTSRAVYGPFDNAQDPRIDQIILKLGPLGENARATLLPLDPPERALGDTETKPGGVS